MRPECSPGRTSTSTATGTRSGTRWPRASWSASSADKAGFRPAEAVHRTRLAVRVQALPAGFEGAKARAHWVCADTIAWPPGPDTPGLTFALHHAPTGGLRLGASGVEGGRRIPLTYDPAGLSAALKARFPHLSGYAALRLPQDRLSDVRGALRGQLAVSVEAPDGRVLDATSLQIPGVLDDLYAYGGELGVCWSNGVPTLRVWSPTARSVTLILFEGPRTPEALMTRAMTFDGSAGTWTTAGEPGWRGKYYLYEVEVYVPSTGRIERNQVTDPYSLSLSRD